MTANEYQALAMRTALPKCHILSNVGDVVWYISLTCSVISFKEV